MPKSILAILLLATALCVAPSSFGQSVQVASDSGTGSSDVAAPAPDQGGGVGSVGGYEVTPKNPPSGGRKNKGLRPPNP